MRADGTRRSRRTPRLAAALALGLVSSPVAGASAKPIAADAHTRHVEILSDTYTIDRIYKSMAGPEGQTQISLWPADPPELLWITGYRVVVVGADGKAPGSQEVMCQNNLDFPPGT